MVGTAEVRRRVVPGLGRRLHRVPPDDDGPWRAVRRQRRERRSVRDRVPGLRRGPAPRRYRSTDHAGNQEATKSVNFTIAAARPGGADGAGVRGSLVGSGAAGACSSRRPGSTRRAASCLYEWDFGDDSGSFDQSPRHTYSEPGTYTATVTVTDPQGKTGTDTVEIVVEDGNQAPVVRATSVPGRGLAPLTVAFSARAPRTTGPRASSRTCGTSMTAAPPLSAATPSTRTGRPAPTRRP